MDGGEGKNRGCTGRAREGNGGGRRVVSIRKKDGREIASERARERAETRRERKERGRARAARRGAAAEGTGARGALEAELCVLLNAGHKLPVFCFRKTMRELTQGRGKSDERGEGCRADSFFCFA